MKKKAVPAILIHLDWIETIKCLSHEQIGAFIIAMLDYANTGKEPKFKDNSMQALFISFKKQIDRDRKSYEEKCKKNSQSAGTTRMVELESIIYSQLKCQGLLCVDELEASIHPNLMEYMLTRFVNKKDNQSQLIVTTHYDPILRDIDDIFGKDL